MAAAGLPHSTYPLQKYNRAVSSASNENRQFSALVGAQRCRKICVCAGGDRLNYASLAGIRE